MRTVVIGVGNPYRRDDGVGPAVVELLRGRGIPVATSLGETTELIELWRDLDVAVVVDAVRTRAARPGRVHRTIVVPDPGTRPTSSHGLGLGDAVELARVLDRLPERLALYAVEVGDVSYGEGLSPPVAAAARRLAGEIYVEVRDGIHG